MLTIGSQIFGELADSVDPRTLPSGMDGYMAYINGLYEDYATTRRLFPGKPVWGLSVNGWPAGQGVDSEWGDASPAVAAQCTKTQLLLGVDRPVVYCPLEWMSETLAAHDALGVNRTDYRLIVAHWDGPTMPGAPRVGMHICTPASCGSWGAVHIPDGTQWYSGPAYDLSLVFSSFLYVGSASGVVPAAGKGSAMPEVGIATCSKGGYWVAGADGTVDAFGPAPKLGDMAGRPLAKPIVGIAAHPSGSGYWLAGADGGVFSFGDAAFYGSMGGQALNSPVTGIAPTVTGNGYRLVAQGGGIFDFGDAVYEGRPA